MTPIGTYQELYVKEIQWGMKVIIRSGGGGSLNAYYTVTADPISVTASWATEPEQLAA